MKDLIAVKLELTSDEVKMLRDALRIAGVMCASDDNVQLQLKVANAILDGTTVQQQNSNTKNYEEYSEYTDNDF